MRVPRLLQTSFIIAATASAAACDRTTSAAVTKDAAPQAIVVANVESHELRRAIDVVGTLAADEEVTVSSEVEGRVLRIAADLGDRVTAGQALVVLDPEKLQYRLDQQRAALGRAMARYGVADLSAGAAGHRTDAGRAAGRRRARAGGAGVPPRDRAPPAEAPSAAADGRRGRGAEGEEGGLRVGAAGVRATCAPTSTRNERT